MGIIEDEIARQNAARTALSGANVSNDGAIAARMAEPRALAGAAVSNDGALAQRFQAPAGPRALAGVNVSADGALAGRMPAAPSMPQPSVDPRALSGVNVSNSGDLGARMNAGPKPVPPPGASSSARAALGGANISNDGALRMAEGQAAQRAAAAPPVQPAAPIKGPGPIARAGQTLGRLGSAAVRGNAIVQGAIAAKQALTAEDGVDQAEALVRGGLAAGSVIPQTALVAAPLSMALGVSDAMGTTDVVKNQVRQWLNGGQGPKTVPQSSPANVLAQMNPQEQQTLLRDFMAGDKATVKLSAPAKSGSGEMFTSLLDRASAQQWMNGPGAQRPGQPTAQSTVASPVARAPGPIQRASGAVSKPAAPTAPAMELAGPEELPARGVIQAFGGNGSGGDTNTVQNVQTLEVPAALNAGDQSPVQVLRGNVPSQFATNEAGKYVESATVGKTLPEQLAYTQRVSSTFGPEAAAIQARMATNAADNQTRLQVEQTQGETSRAVAGTQAGAHIQGAQIGAAAQRYGVDARQSVPQVESVEEDVIGPDGNPMTDKLSGLPARTKTKLQWDGEGWVPVKAKVEMRDISKADYQRILSEIGDQSRADKYMRANNLRVKD